MAREGIELDLEDEPVLLETQIARTLIGIFWQLHNSRGSNGFGPSAISFVEMNAFQQMTSEKLTPWMVAMIQRLDVLFLNAFAAAQPKNK